MAERVYFIGLGEDGDENELMDSFRGILKEADHLNFLNEKDIVAVKTHFGESSSSGFIRPEFLKILGVEIRGRGGIPFLTETSTLYRGNRTNAVDHIRHAASQGFSIEKTGMPVIMSDGLLGDEEIEIEIKGKLYKKVAIASMLKKIQALVTISHFTGHIVSGFGGALKNLGMGLSSRRGKMVQHSTSKPSIKRKFCTACGECMKWCPSDAISYKEGKAFIDKDLCIGCAECLTVCRFDAVGYNWSESYEKLQKKIVEHAMGVVEAVNNRILFVNFLTRISKDCDCMTAYEKISPDIGILISRDPVAIDSASLDLVEDKLGKKLSAVAHDIPYRVQLDYSEELGFGSRDYEMVKI